jgi:RNA polymerase sigma factor (sigma-70 family)
MVAAPTLIDSAEPGFERLFIDEYGRVVSIAFRITRDAAEAEDVAQEAFIRFARRRKPNFHNPRAWLYPAAVHLALNAVRARARRNAREQRAFLVQRTALESAQTRSEPQNLIERASDAQRVRRALARISRRHAQLLALRYAGLSYREIADVLRIDVAQVGTRLARAERAFKQEIDREPSR